VAGLVVFHQDRGQHRGQRSARLVGGVAGPALLLGPGGGRGQPLGGGAAFSGSPDNLSGAVGQHEEPGDEEDEQDDKQNHVHAHQVSVDRVGQVDHIVRSNR
jgi:hypothetical protein